MVAFLWDIFSMLQFVSSEQFGMIGIFFKRPFEGDSLKKASMLRRYVCVCVCRCVSVCVCVCVCVSFVPR